MTQPVVSFFYEFASTYSYPAAMRVDEAAKAAGVRVAWRPFLLGPIFADAGLTTSPFNLNRAKGDYMWRDLQRVTGALGLALTRPDPFPQNTLLAARMATALPDDGRRADFSRAVYRAEFGEGKAISDPQVLAALADRLGLGGAALLVQAGTDTVKQALRASVDEARSHGVFGAPSFVAADGELFWGNDRMEQAFAWAKGEKPGPAAG
ncbi:2-hydroxychromene-2-carboxylate isomerase [Phreatobacter sp.]|uniref:2-hydroxychromene-2-carboxylate isomerase n=1 Tax=Phreatobacter sp. TaxID=1966341 RepID=UPI003F727163